MHTGASLIAEGSTPSVTNIVLEKTNLNASISCKTRIKKYDFLGEIGVENQRNSPDAEV